MDQILKQLLSGVSNDWVQMLTKKLGFDVGDAGKFVQQVIAKLGPILQSGELSKLLDADVLRGKFDLASLAKSAGIDADKAARGLDTVLPDLVKRAKTQLGGAEGMLGKIAPDAGAMLGKLFGK